MIGHHRFKLVLSFAQVWLVRESVYGLYVPTLSNREMWQEEVCYSRACARCLVWTQHVAEWTQRLGIGAHAARL